MAQYHCHISVASRSKGHSAVAGAAYQSRSKMVADYDGRTHDYRRAHQHEQLVYDGGVALPDGAPGSFSDRSVLWNEVERVEKSATSQLARRIEYALPVELSRAEQIALADRIASDFAAMGMCVDYCIHDAHDGHNPHCHMLMPLRGVGPKGLLPKSQSVYLVRNVAGEERELTAAELKAAPDFEKVFTFVGPDKKKRELTMTEAASVEGLKRKGRNPVKSCRYLVDWNDKGKAEEWRSLIADRINGALKGAGRTERVDHRSYERRGIDLVPHVHEGLYASRLEKENDSPVPATDRRAENLDVDRRNRAIRQSRERQEEAMGVLEKLAYRYYVESKRRQREEYMRACAYEDEARIEGRSRAASMSFEDLVASYSLMFIESAARSRMRNSDIPRGFYEKPVAGYDRNGNPVKIYTWVDENGDVVIEGRGQRFDIPDWRDCDPDEVYRDVFAQLGLSEATRRPSPQAVINSFLGTTANVGDRSGRSKGPTR